MTRRAFLSVLCGAVAWPLAAAAQQGTNKKRLAIFSPSVPSADLHEHSVRFGGESEDGTKCEVPTGSEIVFLSGKTGSHRRIARTTRLTP
jgi:hypothetical protein